MENALYYTFSTIAQALAAAIALVTAFVFFRLQGIDVALREAGFMLMQGHLQNVEMWDLYVRGDYEQFVALFVDLAAKANRPISPDTIGPELYAKFRFMQAECRVPITLVPPFRRALVLSAVVMGGSVVCLWLAPKILKYPLLAELILFLGALGFVACLAMYFFLIMRILGRRAANSAPAVAQ